ncbi:hypothetical protein KRX57_01345 [Weeksellaceae bacterium TAE3-ERU29]|nr:hypothetical protein [Weeksellaceae bacterium TAE3-ERU29]
MWKYLIPGYALYAAGVAIGKLVVSFVEYLTRETGKQAIKENLGELVKKNREQGNFNKYSLFKKEEETYDTYALLRQGKETYGILSDETGRKIHSTIRIDYDEIDPELDISLNREKVLVI